MSLLNALTDTILAAYPSTQAIYLFGSWGTTEEWPSSDVDIAVLLPPEQTKQVDVIGWNRLTQQLATLVHKEVDLLNLREVSTVFQKEVVMAERRILTVDEYAADEFEMLVLSYYQKLNEERAEIMTEGLASGRFYNV
ncbi:MAG: hypothetical protein FD130_2439 [Halothiobacillaceae bacterium]|nr:MAG: hypothetical protein FD130_2439 [Halothiobacillaceae bacterium]